MWSYWAMFDGTGATSWLHSRELSKCAPASGLSRLSMAGLGEHSTLRSRYSGPADWRGEDPKPCPGARGGDLDIAFFSFSFDSSFCSSLVLRRKFSKKRSAAFIVCLSSARTGFCRKFGPGGYPQLFGLIAVRLVNSSKSSRFLMVQGSRQLKRVSMGRFEYWWSRRD